MTDDQSTPPLQADWCSIAGDGPELVYVPGLDGSGELLLGAAQRLEEHFRLGRLCYQLSEWRAPETAYAGLARSIVERFDADGITRPLIVAESFGVAVALRIALDFPERVRGLLLVNGFARYQNQARLRAGRALSAVLPPVLFRVGRYLGAQQSLFAPRKNAQVLTEFRALKRLKMDAGYRFRMAMIQSVDWLDELDRVACPTHVFASECDRVVGSVRAGKQIVERIPGARFELIPKAGHLVLALPEEPWIARLQTLAAEAAD